MRLETRIARQDTVSTLNDELRRLKITYSRWAVANGINKAYVFFVMNGKPITIERENIIREALGMRPINEVAVVIDPEMQKIVRRQPPREYITRQVRLAPDEAKWLDETIRNAGYESFSEWWKGVGSKTLKTGGYEAESGRQNALRGR